MFFILYNRYKIFSHENIILNVIVYQVTEQEETS